MEFDEDAVERRCRAAQVLGYQDQLVEVEAIAAVL